MKQIITKIGNDIKVGNGPLAIGVAPDKGYTLLIR